MLRLGFGNYGSVGFDVWQTQLGLDHVDDDASHMKRMLCFSPIGFA